MAVLVAGADFFFHWHGYHASSLWRRGLRGDEQMARLLRHTLERRGYRTLHNRVVPGVGSADQIVVGPGGAWLLHNDAWHPETEISRHGDQLFVDGRTPSKLVREVRGKAAEVSRVLSDRLGEEISVTPLFTVHGGRLKHPPFIADGIVFATPIRMIRWIHTNPERDLTPEQIERVVRAGVHRLPIGGRTMDAA